MKIMENPEVNMRKTMLSDDSKFIKNILLKAVKNESLKESYLNKSNIQKIKEDFNAGKILLTPLNEDDVILAYNPKITESSDGMVTITGYSTKDHIKESEPNVSIKLTTDEFFNLLSIK